MGHPSTAGGKQEEHGEDGAIPHTNRRRPGFWDERLHGTSAAEEGLDAGEGANPKRLTDTERLGYDAVNLPDHYKQFKIEPVRFTVENRLNFLQASIIKYVVRYPHKNGIEDLKKCARMLDMLIAFEEGDQDWWMLPGERASRRTYIV